MKGSSKTTFSPDDGLTRAQFIMMLWKLDGSPEMTGELPFTDVTGRKLSKAVNQAYQTGISKGTSATTFSPDQECTRLEMVFFLYKYHLNNAL